MADRTREHPIEVCEKKEKEKKRKQYKASCPSFFLIWRKRSKSRFISFGQCNQSPKRRLQALKILPFFCFFFFILISSMDPVCIVPAASMASSSSRLPGGDWRKAVADWSWILRYLSDTDEDLRMEKALFRADWSEAEEVTELFLLRTPPPKLPVLFLPYSWPSASWSWAVGGLMEDGVLEVRFWAFLGVWGKERRSAKSMDLDLEALLRRNFNSGYPFILFFGA